MMFPRAGILLSALTLGISAFIFALAPQNPTFKVDVNVVNVLATVRDHSGHIVSNLSQEDFILEEDGQKQEIRYFSRQTDLPLTIGLLVDTSMSQRNLIEDERNASFEFLDQVLKADKDRAFVIKFDMEAELLQDITSSHSLLQKAINALKPPVMLRRPSNQPGGTGGPGLPLAQIWPPSVGGRRMPGGQRRPGGGQGGPQSGIARIGTVLYDAVFLASDEILQNEEGRKAIILISDGVDAGSKCGEKDAIDAAHRADTLIYGIRYFDSSVYMGGATGQVEGAKGKGTLKALSKETGGVAFEVTKKLTLSQIYSTIQEELRNQYSLGYIPPEAGGDSFRRIILRTKDGKLDVTTRAGYYPKRP